MDFLTVGSFAAPAAFRIPKLFPLHDNKDLAMMDSEACGCADSLADGAAEALIEAVGRARRLADLR